MSALLRKLVWSFRRRKKEAELREEMEFHLEGDIAEKEAGGASADFARSEARREFGNLARLREETRGTWGWTFMDNLVQDLRYAFRTMRTSWVFATLAIGSLAVGIGANTALFSVVRSTLFAELPVPRPDELVAFQWVGPNTARGSARNYGFTVADGGGPAGSEFSLAMFDEFRRANESLIDLAAFAPAEGLSVVAAGGSDAPDAVDGQYVSGNYHRLLGIEAFRGRTIAPEDDAPSAEPVVVIGHEYWERRFNADPNAIGRAILINGMSFTVIGVTGPDAADPRGLGNLQTAPAVTMPLGVEARLPKTNQTLSNRAAAWWLLLMGRLGPGTDRTRAEANFRSVFERTARNEWEIFRNESGTTAPVDPQFPTLRIVSGAGGIYGVPSEGILAIGLVAALFAVVLLVVCVNLASLLLSRMTARQQEIDVRQAVGASRPRLVQQLLTENLTLALAGGTLGILVAYWSLETLERLLPPAAGIDEVGRMDWTVLAFALAVSVATVAIFALVPALRLSRAGRRFGVNEGRGSTRSRLSKSLLTTEVALTVLLLVSAGLFVQTLDNLKNVAVGFDPENVLVFRTDAPLAGYAGEESLRIYDRVLEEIRSIPGVEDASLSGFAPLTGSNRSTLVQFPDQEPVVVATLNVHPDYFRTMRIPLVQGRGFDTTDGPGAPRVAVVNDAFARTIAPGSEAVGSRFQYGSPESGSDVEIVGIVANARFARVRDPAPPVVYTPHAQSGIGSSSRVFEVRTGADPSGMVRLVWDAVRRVDSRLPFFDASTYVDGINNALLGERVLTAVTALFGALAVALSMTGLFGLMSYRVARKTKEIGIRMALGAGSGTVLRAVIGESLILVGIGVVLGLAAAAVVTPVIESMLFGLSPHDPATMAIVVTVMIGVGVAAAIVPARRAARVDPLIALRYE